MRMAYVLVTGPSGTLGSVLVPRLLAAGHAVRVLAHCRTGDFGPEVEIAHGDVRRLADVMEAASGVDVIVHAATSVFRAARSTEIDGARAVVAAAGASGAHLTYPSIVGVDVIGGTYYRAKLQAE
jgi:nucleoside-diphosphate-sugar epimerase